MTTQLPREPHQQESATPAEISPQPPRYRYLPWIGLGLVGVLAAGVGVGSYVSGHIDTAAGTRVAAASSPSASTAWDREQREAGDGVFLHAQRTCDDTKSDSEVADRGRTIVVVARVSDDEISSEGEALACILGELDCPIAVRAHLYNTRMIDGRQQDAWGDVTASWVYGIDSGFNVIIQKK